MLVRNPNWDAATDPLGKAWVDRIEITPDVPIASIQRAIEREEADLSLDSHVRQAQVATLRPTPRRRRRTVRAHRRTGLHDPGAGVVRLPPLRPVPDPRGRGDSAKARALLADAGYPNGLTLTFVAWSTGSYVDTIKPIRASLPGQGIWALDYLAGNARQSIVPQYDSRLDPAVSATSASTTARRWTG